MTPSSSDARRVNEQIADALQRDIESGRFKAEEKLPAVRQIAERFDAAAGTVSKALQLLVQRGLVRADSTRGYFVNSREEREKKQPSPEFSAIMREIESIRDHVARLDGRLRELEEQQDQG
ncbi:winged helix-turn-helix domain-containing protein [Streptomyces sp. NPDC045470]|uniref:winged helix-turn-helix domain-containing protein n=1 Tax=Streptomyces sp. NPDC045470 TaxID=3155469 RepID=UPI0033D8A41F